MKILGLLVVVAPLLVGSVGCVPKSQPVMAPQVIRELPVDPHSFANAREVSVEHLGLDLTVDFSKRILSGTATLGLANHKGASEVVLDTNGLDIASVTLEPGAFPAAFRMGDPFKFLGRPLHIDIKPSTRAVRIVYSTSPDAGALQWLDSGQTAGKKRPFLFTQSESILARTWIPCQDTPGVRMTYDATLHVPPDLLAVMSADGNPETKNAEGIYHFSMPQRIPSYLLALAVGDLAFRQLGGISGVYAEPLLIDRAASELADTPKMIEAAEQLYGPYRWGRYDILVLPPSFPFGGMENPRLTFATPTILAGDRSLVSLVAHELAHSWSGNLVTNATWNDFWLNEGFTDYFERRIDEKLYGKEFADEIAILGLTELNKDIAGKGATSPDTALHLSLEGRDPDDGVGPVAYEKGALFLTMIEQSVGRERLDSFLRKYFDHFAFQSMDTATFLSYMQEQLFGGEAAAMERLNVHEWVYGPGLPANVSAIRSARFEAVDKIAAALAAGAPASSIDVNGWTTNEWLRFLGDLPASLGATRLAELDDRFHLSANGNAMILKSWFLLAIQNGYHDVDLPLEHYLTTIGRRFLVKALYQALAKTPEGKEFALRVYRNARPGYHAVTRQTIDALLGWKG
jgi:leukotriene-A4 hydrolase